MSKRRRDRGDNPDDLLGALRDTQTAPETEFTASDIANQAYGSQVPFEGMTRAVRARPVAIDQIHPDPAQPRRAIPSAIRHYWDGNPQNVPYLLTMWVREVEVERGRPFDAASYLAGTATDRVPLVFDEAQLGPVGGRTGALESALLRVIDLAASIRRDGLTNPITVVYTGGEYFVETGERRWLAYHLLNMHRLPQDDDWSKIPARIVENMSLWRQASENNARDDLNAIARARQFALLLMDLHGWQNFRPFEDFREEQGFYAQVADGERWRIPRGSGEPLLNAMGLSHPNQLRHIRRLLRLPAVVWMLADDLNWSENFIQKDLLATAADEDDLIRRAVLQARSEGYSVSSLTVYDHLLPPSRPSEETALPTVSDLVQSDMRRLLRKIRRYSPDERRQLASHLRQMADEIEAAR